MHRTLRNFLRTSSRYLLNSDEPMLQVKWAQSQHEVMQAQKLRYTVFTEDFRAEISSPEGCDRDVFDVFCKHLIAIEAFSGRVVGTYRVLLPEDAKRAGNLYMETEFDLAQLSGLKHDVIELGRSCVAPDYRDGTVIRRLLTGLAEFLSTRNERYLIGCVSVPMFDGGFYATSIYKDLSTKPKHESQYRVTPIAALPATELYDQCDAVLPPLMRSYLKLGARLMGQPFYDAAFHCADFPMILEVERLERKFGKSMRRIAA